MDKMKIKNTPIDGLRPYAHNPKTHPEAQIDKIARSIEEFGWTVPILIDGDNSIIAGHGRLLAARKLGLIEIPTICVDHLTEAQMRAYRIADNRLTESAWDLEMLESEIAILQDMDFDIDLTGFDDIEIGEMFPELGDSDFGDDETLIDEVEHIKLVDKFIVPPFSVMDTRQGYWQERKRAWLGIGIKGEIGRGDDLTWSDPSAIQTDHSRCSADQRSDLKGVAKLPDYVKNGGGCGMEYIAPNTSMFDPVLCEIAYRWFCPGGGAILDPFAGGSVRGIVAGYLGYQYTGVDLSEKQVAANKLQAEDILGDDLSAVQWIIGDSCEIDQICAGDEYDLIFSCPPYGDLEVYSDDPADISTMDYSEFITAYREIINKSASMLKDDRFAVFVVGDIRDKKGFYRNFVSDTITAFQDAGCTLYNEAILVNVAGSLPIRIGKQFGSYRKLGKMHQNVLIFYKGDIKAIKQNYGEIVIDIEPEPQQL